MHGTKHARGRRERGKEEEGAWGAIGIGASGLAPPVRNAAVTCNYGQRDSRNWEIGLVVASMVGFVWWVGFV